MFKRRGALEEADSRRKLVRSYRDPYLVTGIMLLESIRDVVLGKI
jgi:hypothetical protein